MTYRDRMNLLASISTSALDCGPDLHGRRSIRARGLASTAIVTPAILAAVVGLWPSPAASQTTDTSQVVAVCAQNFPSPTELACGAGSSTVAGGGGTTAIGVNARANTINATAVGQASTSNGNGSTAVGVATVATGSWSTAVGNASVATGSISAVAVGDAAKAAANFSSAFGGHSTAGGSDSTAVGGHSTANFPNSMALGAGVSTTIANQIVVGTAANIYQLPGVTSAASLSSQTGVVRVVTSDTTGHLATMPVGGGPPAWALVGNTIGAADYIGTNNALPFVVKTFGQERMRVTSGGDLGIGTPNPTARTEISHSDLTPNTVALRVSNTSPTGAYTESAIGFNVALGLGTGPNPNYFASRIYSKYDSTWAADGRITMQVRNGLTGAPLTDVLTVKHNGPTGRVGVNTIAPLNPLHVVGTVRLELAGPATTHLCYTGTTPSFVIADCSPSDARLKTNVLPLGNVLDKLQQVRGVSFEWNDQYRALGGSSDRREIGVLAQEVEQAFPELVSMGEGDYKRVDYDRLTAVLIEAVKELRKENDALKKRTDALERTKS